MKIKSWSYQIRKTYRVTTAAIKDKKSRHNVQILSEIELNLTHFRQRHFEKKSQNRI